MKCAGAALTVAAYGLVMGAAPAAGSSNSKGSVLYAGHLRCEYQEDPLGIQTTNPRFSWSLDIADPASRGVRQTAYRILLSSKRESLALQQADAWDTGKVSSGKIFAIQYAGKRLNSFAAYYWSVGIWSNKNDAVQWSKPAKFQMGMLHADDWKAKWIGAEGDALPLPIFRKAFSIDKPIAQAVAYISGLGQYEMHVNGKKAGDAVLMPGWTNYKKTVFYNSYDVTDSLRNGSNVIAVMLGNGMYNVAETPDRYTKFAGSFGALKLICQLRLTYTDGSSGIVTSDSSWRFHSGPITFSSIYGGEDYDARLEPDGWDAPGFDEHGWRGALEVEGPAGRLTAQENPNIEVKQIFQTERVIEPRPGIHVYDLGQNFSGWPDITVRGAAGATVKMVPGESLDTSGLVDQDSSGKPQWFSYTLKGGGSETWHPRFSYYGFRYVQVELTANGGSGKPEVVSLRGDFVHSGVDSAGEFKCSNDLFNRIHKLIGEAIKSNTQSIFTDCPHREKLGWLEESHLLGSSVMYNYDVARLYEKVSDDMRDAQQADGMVPDIAPEYPVFSGGFRDSPEWGSAVVLNPWIAYQHYGDMRALKQHYDGMKRYAAYLGSKAKDGIVSYGLGDWYDIGPGEPGVSKLTSLGVTATAIYYADIEVLRKAAVLLQKEEDVKAFEELGRAVRSSFNSHLYHPDNHVYDRGSQTAYAMPLVLGIVPDQDRSVVLSKLVGDIRQHANHVTAGDIGFHFVVSALLQGGRSDVLFDMLSRTDSPSYGYQLNMGATSLTEAWDANPKSSQNHFMLGHAEEWFYRGLAGIDFDLSRPNLERIIIHPWPVGDVTQAEATYKSIIGNVVSSWTRNRGRFDLYVTVPPNETATVFVPGKDGRPISQSAERGRDGHNVHLVREDPQFSVYRVRSGQYHFSAKLERQ